MSFRRNPQFVSGIRNTAASRLVVAGDAVRLKMGELVNEEKGGVHYPGNPNPSSAPGEPPASQSGDMVDSLEVSNAIQSPNSVDVHVFSWLTRSRVLQQGTVTKAPRPYMLLALIDSSSSIINAVSDGGASGN